MEDEKMTARKTDRLSRPASAAGGGIFVLGLLWCVAGFLCLAATGLASLAAVYYVGALMAMAGLFGIIWGFRGAGAGPMILGILSLVVGVLLFIHPGTGLVSLTLLMIGYFWMAGLYRTVTSLFERYEGWGFDFAYGLCAIAVGAIAARAWPLSSFWLLGILVSVELIARGALMMGTAVAARRVARALHT